MNYKLIYIITPLLFIQFLNAQVGIGTASPNSQLDIRSTNQSLPANNDGILIPKVDVFPAINPTVLQQSMLVYLTTTTTFSSVLKTPGFYYWDNATTNWIGIQTQLASNWSSEGNTATNPSINFIGTTDNKDIVFKRNGIRAGYIGDPSYDMSFNFNNGNTVFGANSLLNPTLTFSPQTGVRNSAFGVNVMPNLTTGTRNVGFGEFALYSNLSGSENTSVGSGSMFSNTTGVFNVAFGRNALTTSNGSYNTSIGVASLRQNSTGSNNTALGFEALRGVLGSGNVGIGYQAGRAETGSNKLYIENSSNDANSALIYGEFDNNIVRINGQLQIGNQATTGYKYPTSRGNSGQTLQTDASGTLTWTNSLANLSLMRVVLNTDQTFNSVGWQKIIFDTSLFDTNLEFNSSSNRFIASKTGFFEINAGLHTYNKADAEYYGIAVYKNGVEYQETSSHHYGDKLIARTVNCVVELITGDYIEIYFYNGNAPTNIDSFSGKTYFEVKQLK